MTEVTGLRRTNNMNKDILILRELAKDVLKIASDPVQKVRKDLWTRQNSFKCDHPLIYIRAFAFHEILPFTKLKCEDPFFRKYEYELQMYKFRDTIGDDFIVEPWILLDPVYIPQSSKRWGLPVELGDKPSEYGAAAYKPSIVNEDDIYKLSPATHQIDYIASMSLFDKLNDAIGDILTVHLNKGPIFSIWAADLSTDLAKLRGLEQIMWDAYDRPEWLHKLLTLMRDAVLKNQNEAELSGDFSLLNHQNQCMPYSLELDPPKPGVYGVTRKNLWCFTAAQEFTTFGPDMFEEFMLSYQIPIMEKYGLCAYGCCEDLTKKIGLLRKISNLRRIAVSPFADLKKCSELIGSDFILSWRPDPSSMISMGIDEDHVRKTMREAFNYFKSNGNFFDITLKDVETISYKPENVSRWVKIVREEIENFSW